MIKVADKKTCCGCYSCENICPQSCISMKADQEGFWYPIVNQEECIECNLCVKHCPIHNTLQSKVIPEAYACVNLNETIRMSSASGGLFSLFAGCAIENGGVVYGAAFDDDFIVRHKRAETKEALEDLRGVKYVQSQIGDTFREIKNDLKSDKFVYFSGTPCQVNALHIFLEKEYERLICQDIICHGVPSPKSWGKYVKELALKRGDKVKFRDKSTGWEQYSFFAETKSKRVKQSFKDNPYMIAFLNNLSLRPSCYKCKYKSVSRVSDITLADFWGINNVIPEMNDNKGTSLVFIHTEKGKKLFNYILPNIKIKR